MKNRSIEGWSRKLDVAGLVAAHGSPLYVTNLGRLRENAKPFVALTGAARRVAFPVKANPSASILSELAELGCSADCASRSEVEAALESGYGDSRILYNTPAPDIALMRDLLARGGSVVVDSEAALLRLEDHLRGETFAGRIFVRISPDWPIRYDAAASWRANVAHASPQGQFGIAAEALVELLRRVELPIVGLHVHVGTQMDRLATFVETIERLHRLADEIGRVTSHRIEAIDLGGGLGIPFREGDAFPALEAYAAAVGAAMRPGLEYLVEPGHALVGDAVVLITTIQEIKTVRGRRWAIVDVGANELVRSVMLGWHHPILGPGGELLATQGPDAIAGPHCFAGDVLLPATDLSGVERGDLLRILHVGAYCNALSNRFNGTPPAGGVVIDGVGL